MGAFEESTENDHQVVSYRKLPRSGGVRRKYEEGSRKQAHILSCVVVDRTLVKRDVSVADVNSSSALRIGACIWSVLGSFFDRGRSRKVPRRFTKASAHSISLVGVDVGVADCNLSTVDVHPAALPHKGRCLFLVSSREFLRSGGVRGKYQEGSQTQART